MLVVWMPKNTAQVEARVKRRFNMGSILIIDDEEDIRDALQMVLESVGHDVKVASNGNEAV